MSSSVLPDTKLFIFHSTEKRNINQNWGYLTCFYCLRHLLCLKHFDGRGRVLVSTTPTFTDNEGDEMTWNRRAHGFPWKDSGREITGGILTPRNRFKYKKANRWWNSMNDVRLQGISTPTGPEGLMEDNLTIIYVLYINRHHIILLYTIYTRNHSSEARYAPWVKVEYRKLFEFHNQQLFTSKITTKSFIYYSLQVETMNVRPIWIVW